jgi:hypothetical protein
MRHFLFEEKEYRINPSFRRARREQDSAQALARFLKRKGTKTAGRSGGGKAVDARQMCVVKAQYSNSIEAHRVQLEKYLVREGTDIDGGRAKLYGTDLDEYRQNMTAKNFRIFLSPQSDKVEPKELAQRFIKKLELQTGYKLYWQGANHYNTAHPHAHLLINGVDKNGKEVFLPRDVIKTFMRETARDICTSMIGSRTRQDMELEREQALGARRYTKLDERIKELCHGTFRVNLDGLAADRGRVLTRLENLRKMNLCEYKNGGYRLSANWREDLQANGRYNKFLESRRLLRYSAPSRLAVYQGAAGKVSGKVTKIFRLDGDASDNHAVLLEGLDGRAYFAPLLKKPEVFDREGKTALREGDFITLETKENQQGRLTPVMFKQDEKQIRYLIRKNNFNGELAKAVTGKAAEQGGVRR